MKTRPVKKKQTKPLNTLKPKKTRKQNKMWRTGSRWTLAKANKPGYAKHARATYRKSACHLCAPRTFSLSKKPSTYR
jgi:hypothetical protein